MVFVRTRAPYEIRVISRNGLHGKSMDIVVAVECALHFILFTNEREISTILSQ